MSTHNIHFMINYEKFTTIYLNICFLELLEGTQKPEFESVTIKEASVFESLFYCIIK